MGNLVITVPEMPAHCFTLLHASGAFLGGEKNIFGFRVINYTYRAFVRAPGRVQWGGLQGMGLDDDIPIRKVLPFRDAWITRGSGFLLGTVFQGKKCILVASLYLHLFQSFPGIRGGRNGWMGLTGFGCLSKIGRSYQVIVLFLISCSGSGIALNRLIIPKEGFLLGSVLRYMEVKS